MNWNVLTIAAIVLAIIGVWGVLGFAYIPKAHRDKDWAKDYKRERGFGVIILAAGCWVLDILNGLMDSVPKGIQPTVRGIAPFAVSAIVIIYFVMMENKYKEMLADYEPWGHSSDTARPKQTQHKKKKSGRK